MGYHICGYYGKPCLWLLMVRDKNNGYFQLCGNWNEIKTISWIVLWNKKFMFSILISFCWCNESDAKIPISTRETDFAVWFRLFCRATSMLVTILRCWWRFRPFWSPTYSIWYRPYLNISVGHQHPKDVTKV